MRGAKNEQLFLTVPPTPTLQAFPSLQPHMRTRPGRWLVAVRDPAVFASVLVACWQNGVMPLVSADLQEESLLDLRREVVAVIHDGQLPLSAWDLPDFDINRFATPPAALSGPEKLMVSVDDVALYLFTSGSTGRKKLISKRFGDLLYEVDGLERLFGAVRRGATVVSTVSHFHIYGLLFCIVWPMRHGHAFGTFPVLHWDEVGNSDNPLFVISTPAHLRLLPAARGLQRVPWERSLIFSSGGPLASRVASSILRETGQAPVEVFGSTETGGVAYRQQRDADVVGYQPFPDVCVRIDTEGRIHVSSLWCKEAATGDTGRWVTADQFVLTGRYDSIVKVAGKRVSLEEMAAVLTGMEQIKDARIVFIEPDDNMAREYLAAVLATDDIEWQSSDAVGQCRRLLLQRFDSVVLPRKWRFVQSMPHNAQGKVTRHQLLKIVNMETAESGDTQTGDTQC